MLKTISPLISPALLALLAEMGHGDELVLADANFPAATLARRLVRADGLAIPPLLEGLLRLLPLDGFVTHPAAVMRRVDAPQSDAPIWREYQTRLDAAEGRSVAMERLERFAFYERARASFAIVATGETALYGNLILKKGVIAP